MKKIIIANWKMNPLTERSAIRLARAEDFRGVVIAPPFVFLEAVSHRLKKAKLAAQDLAREEERRGPYTGEVSAKMLKDADVRYVIVGHSERRRFSKETDTIINEKIKLALKEKLKVILCVGEPWSVRKRGFGASKKFVKNQLRKDLKGLNPKSYILNSRLIIAYEPVWAIGTGRADKPRDAVEMIKFIKKNLKPRSYILNPKVLYGGSVIAKNAKGFLEKKEIDGALVGGASLKPKEFKRILNIN